MRAFQLMVSIACATVLASQAYAQEFTWTIDMRNIELHRVFTSSRPTPANPNVDTRELVNKTGFFKGFDGDSDGILTSSEVTAVSVLVYSWQDWFGTPPPDFRYTSSGDLRIVGEEFRTRLDFGKSASNWGEGYDFDTETFYSGSVTYTWTPDTTTIISGPMLVPEPEAYLLILFGLGLVGCAARRHRRASVLKDTHPLQRDFRL